MTGIPGPLEAVGAGVSLPPSAARGRGGRDGAFPGLPEGLGAERWDRGTVRDPSLPKQATCSGRRRPTSPCLLRSGPAPGHHTEGKTLLLLRRQGDDSDLSCVILSEEDESCESHPAGSCGELAGNAQNVLYGVTSAARRNSSWTSRRPRALPPPRPRTLTSGGLVTGRGRGVQVRSPCSKQVPPTSGRAVLGKSLNWSRPIL